MSSVGINGAVIRVMRILRLLLLPYHVRIDYLKPQPPTTETQFASSYSVHHYLLSRFPSLKNTIGTLVMYLQTWASLAGIVIVVSAAFDPARYSVCLPDRG